LVVAIVLIVVTAKVSIGVRIGTVATIVVVASAALDSISVGIVAVVAIVTAVDSIPVIIVAVIVIFGAIIVVPLAGVSLLCKPGSDECCESCGEVEAVKKHRQRVIEWNLAQY
tara:strand:+ start:734 stop:1072 length:339 start_codon:yes stop_codon:yes gene_type:complete